MARDLLIDGGWIDGAGARLELIDPATGRAHAAIASASPAQVEAAVAAARAAFPGWRRTPFARRVEFARAFAVAMRARAEELARIISEDMGKPLWDSKTEAQAVIGKVELSISALDLRAGERSETTPFGTAALRHNPHGALGVFGPFNFPAHLPNGHIAPALLAGNTIIFKPSELAPRAGQFMGEVWTQIGLPAGVLNIVQGGRDTGAALLGAPDLAGVLFTGSAATGAAIHRRFAGRPDILLALEMGGNNPLIVWPPGDPGACANLIAQSAFLTTGQRCSCARRLIVPIGPAGDRFIDALVALGGALRAGAWDDEPEPFMGPLVSARAARAAADGERALVELGGRSLTALAGPPGEGREAFVRPALIDMTDAGAAPDEEIFAPLLQIFRVRTFEEALDRANATRFGLAGGLLTEDERLWARAQSDLRVGVLNWNRPTTGASGALPFGGPGLSGNLRPSAAYAADYAAYPVAMQTALRPIAIPTPGLPQ